MDDIRLGPFADGDRLVWVQGRNAALGVTGDNLSWDEANAVSTAQAFDGVAVIGGRNLIREDGSRRVDWRGLRVTASLFDVLASVHPATALRAE